ncbi:MAG: hypothetical protein P857_144 [Candidatus Xenolissoclinum pacificiensis L6]|uniref:Uncharacterized protein n=1 Tax=Candidatus Xenolissoclinum pacificiensis L6 TaxID=1401685 RepID=W2UYQ6_9RICK|nr:MAG: hypothetical protein P857_144 [Candidatus Xenolissoclinum pacificiensis L6]
MLKSILTDSFKSWSTHESQLVNHLFTNEKCKYFLADRAYNTNLLKDKLKSSNIEAVIPEKFTVCAKLFIILIFINHVT